MKAVRIHQFGGPEVLTYEDIPDPQPRKDQVLVRVKACSLNHLDVWVRKGLPGVKLPHILGSDIAGEMVEVGEYISGVKPGQRVLVAPMHFCGHCVKCVAGMQNQCREFTVLGNAVDGGNCELFAAPAVNVIPIPDSLRLQPGRQRAAGVRDRVAHAGRTGRSASRADGTGTRGQFGCRHRRDSDREAVSLPRHHHGRRRIQARKRARSRRRLRYQPLQAEDLRRSPQDYEQGGRRHRGRARRRGHLGGEHEMPENRPGRS